MDEVKLEIRECDYRNEHYKVRFDGAVWRCKKDGRKNSRFDEFWTKGDWDNLCGYQIGGVQTCRIIAKAYFGIDDSFAIINFKDYDNSNLSVDNLYVKDKECQDRGYGSIKEAFGCDLKPSVPMSLDGNTLEKPIKYPDLEALIKEQNTPKITDSLTKNARQVNWLSPTKFPLCEDVSTIEEYYSNINIGDIFCKNKLGEGKVVKKAWIKEGSFFYVIVYNEKFELNKWLPTPVVMKDGYFLHGNYGSYRTMVLADKIMRKKLKKEDIEFTEVEEAYL